MSYYSHVVHLVISAGSGGVWKFPISFLATEAEVDDTITVEAVGLNKEAVVGFRLTSQCRSVIIIYSLKKKRSSASSRQDANDIFVVEISSDLLLTFQ